MHFQGCVCCILKPNANRKLFSTNCPIDMFNLDYCHFDKNKQTMLSLILLLTAERTFSIKLHDFEIFCALRNRAVQIGWHTIRSLDWSQIGSRTTSNDENYWSARESRSFCGVVRKERERENAWLLPVEFDFHFNNIQVIRSKLISNQMTYLDYSSGDTLFESIRS